MLLDVSTASRTCHILTGIQRVKTLETLEAGREGGEGARASELSDRWQSFEPSDVEGFSIHRPC